jgi:phosphoglycolate phosphatase
MSPVGHLQSRSRSRAAPTTRSRSTSSSAPGSSRTTASWSGSGSNSNSPWPGARASFAPGGELIREHESASERLGRETDVVQSLLTGNIAANAQVKLGAFGLDALVDLGIGAYGSDHHRRGRLVGVALQKCERKHGATLAPSDVVLIGDTPLDVAAAREGGARAVGVATGPFDTSELAAAGADAVLADLQDNEAVVAAVLAT